MILFEWKIAVSGTSRFAGWTKNQSVGRPVSTLDLLGEWVGPQDDERDMNWGSQQC
jgi:hypothetical protein